MQAPSNPGAFYCSWKDVNRLDTPFNEEKKKLADVLKKVEQQQKTLDGIPRYYGKDPVEQALDAQRQKQRQNLDIAKKEPYFGRLDFQEQQTSRVVPIYIGKVGLQDEDTGDLLVVDWRAPVSSMFYSFSGQSDRAYYDSPDGRIEGTVHLKRNIAIRNQQLERVVDSYVRGAENVNVTDEFLLYRLEENKDHRLRDIVSTIQYEQDQIIRAERNRAIIIQGVPGSGKTTVALHRLAYLLYRYQEKIRPEKMIIFAPNQMFIDYISDVLPELGVGDVKQTTFADWALEQLEEQVELRSQDERLEWWFEQRTEGTKGSEVARFKGSIRFMQLVEKRLDEYEASFVPDRPFVAWENKHLPAEEIQKWFYEEYRHEPLMKRKERVMARIKRWLETEYKEIRHLDPRREIKKKASARLRSFMKTWPNHTPLKWYQQLLRSLPAEYGMVAGKKKEIEWEDLAPLVAIKHRFFGLDAKEVYDHIVLDEAQDVSPYQLAILKKHCRGNSFTILGDLLQNIYSFRGITEWRELAEVFDQDQVRKFELNTSYRSTMEIIRFANQIVSKYAGDVALAKPVYRSGEPVRVIHAGREERLEKLLQLLRQTFAKVQSLAIIMRTEEESRKIYEQLLANGWQPNLILSGQTEYRGGLSILPVYLSKGMEFDAVVMMDLDEQHYPDDELNAKLLFVGCTRALHQLYLLCNDPCSPLIGRSLADAVQEGAVEGLLSSVD